MNATSSTPSPLSPSQYQALYEHTRRQATELRREAMRDAAAGIAAALRAALRAMTPHSQHRTPQAPACPR